MLTVGTEWLIDAAGCHRDALADLEAIKTLFRRIIEELDLHPLNEVWQKFSGPGGVTGLVLLTESHLACHTYPEHGVATFSLYCCRERPRWDWERTLAEHLGAREVRVSMHTRSVNLAEPVEAVTAHG